MKAEHFSRDVQELITLLNKHQVRYLIVGGEAVIYYGYARLTGDVDFFYDSEPENTEHLYAALLEFWGGDVPGLPDAVALRAPDLVVQFGVPPNRIDLLSSISGVDFPTAWSGRLHETLELSDGTSTPLYLLGLEQLLANKRAANRDKDRDDLAYLEEE